MPDRIHRVDGYHHDGYTYYPVVVVGAGESGVATAWKLKRELGFDQFRVFERQSGIGGTWWINRYPGVACDVPAAFYSFSFHPNPKWTTLFPSGPEIYAYLQEVCDTAGITDKIELNTDVPLCRWLDDDQEWEITVHHLVPGTGDLSSRDRARKVQEEGESSVIVSTEIIRAKVLLSAVGGLVEPRAKPENVPGWESFKGPVFHSARWDYNVDLKDKDVVVVGTGCSAAQFVPHLTQEPFGAKSVTQLMRSPPWVVKRMEPPFGREKWAKWAPAAFTYVPGLLKTFRTMLFFAIEAEFPMFRAESTQKRRALEEKLIRHIKRTTPEKYHEILTPDYDVCCKRRIFDATWYPGLNDPRVELTTQPLTAVHEDSVTIGPGRCYPPLSRTESKAPTEKRDVHADVIILANGFDISKWLHPMAVKGRGGVDLVDQMHARGGPQAYQGTAMDGFPNFFLIFGPNTATGHSSVILATENMANYALKFVKKVIRGEASTVEVKRSAEEAYTADIQRKLKDTVWMRGGCASWYYTEDGWNSTVLPYSQIWFGYRCMFPRWRDWDVKLTRRGTVKQALHRGLRLSVFAAALVGLWRARRAGLGPLEAVRLLLASVSAQGKSALGVVREVLHAVVERGAGVVGSLKV
ncbi:FAD/NAD(P)-binding domain-containing protein [Trichodelitschia bisporula]|uniref:FAD/NAD(P)-binding domain-containing protein n=1 Tax=Trichodelitschia bisporula TaxID=703511 RepID=A0A6G1HZK0_9PEZI|nr:FAD/NAD(P)-binding domain-containing protein [Trichodelitschia bisporula]